LKDDKQDQKTGIKMTDKRRSYSDHRDKYSDTFSGGADSNGGRSSFNNSSNSGGAMMSNKYDEPPNSRLFIVCGKNITEEQFRESFGEFGTIEEVWVLKDRGTQEPKGITYIKFSKTSEAALAMEEMNGRTITGSPRPLKVMIAHSRDQGSRRDMNEDERLVRLFVVVPKSHSESDLRGHFSEFGDIDYVSIVRDRVTKENKGFAYVKYHRMSHAAKAFEGCDRTFKPVFADPKPTKNDYAGALGGDRGGGMLSGGGGREGGHQGHNGPGSTASGSTSASMSAYDMLSMMDTSTSNPDSCCRLSVSASGMVNQDQLWKLFDLVPGLDYCDQSSSGLRQQSRGGPSMKSYFNVVYNNPQSAAYAKEKLHGFEYPPGHRIVVKFDFAESMRPPPAPRRPIQNDLAHLTETIANATALLQAAGYPTTNLSAPNVASTDSTTSIMGGDTYDPAYCSVKLPPPQPLAAMDSVVAERLFIVCTPVPPQLYAMKDVFGRFGNLIDIYMLNGKTCGYAKYATKESADKAIEALHGQELCGSRLKVMPAEPHEKSSLGSSNNASEGTTFRKRPKISD
jgi:RNA recognition motif-containing protein